MKQQTKSGRKLLLALSCGLALTALLCSCGSLSSILPGKNDAESVQETEAAAPTEIAAAADGQPDSLLCKDSYQVEASEGVADLVVAQAGSAFLTNSQLQPYYYMAVSDYMQAAQAPAPDLSIPLDCQLCPLGDGKGSWQHYFLEQALSAWYNAAILSQKAEEPMPCTEEAFATNTSYYADNINESLPAYELIYGDKPNYKPNTMHQAYLDELPALLDEQAKEAGFADLSDLSSRVFGEDNSEAFAQAARTYNFGYMFFTEKRYDMTPGQFNVEKYTPEATTPEATTPGAATPDAATPEAPTPENPAGEPILTIRSLLRIPEGAEVAADGTVTASEAAWAMCREAVDEMLKKWPQEDWMKSRTPDAAFSRLARKHSDDLGTDLVGGEYVRVTKGQLTPILDAWCFDEARKVGDYETFRTPFGIQVIYISKIQTESEMNALRAVTVERTNALMTEVREQFPLTVDYSKAALWTKTDTAAISLNNVLYPDVAHQRFPEAIVYLQQDYPRSSYGGGTVARGGCGITTMAMLATYMTDTIYSPGYLAKIYGSYRTPDGTNGDIFRYVPAELGFQYDYSTPDYDTIFKELEQNKRVISLQILGHFTRAGHYLLLERTNPDGTVVIRDSNIFNYKRLPGHMVDCFTKSDILSGNAIFYVMDEKVDRIPACSRCGDPEHTQTPSGMLNSPYLCEKCTAALSRRSDYMQLGGC